MSPQSGKGKTGEAEFEEFKPTGDIYPADLEELTSLDAQESNITDLIGLEYCPNLIWLHLRRNQIDDMSHLGDLSNLTRFNLGINQTISPL